MPLSSQENMPACLHHPVCRTLEMEREKETKRQRERERWQVIEKDNYVTFIDFTNSINLLLSICDYT